MSLKTPDRIRQLQKKLYEKAKQEPAYRFYLLYDKVYREDILEHAWRLVREHQGAAGVDGMSIGDIEERGVKQWLAGLGEELRAKTYTPDPVRRVLIDKRGGGQRPLGIPTLRDRVVQTAAKLVLEPILEAELEPSAYGYRPGRSAQDAVAQVYASLRAGHWEVVDADLSRYFDSIPHHGLMQTVARRVSDRHLLRLVKLWLKAEVVERDEQGRSRRSGGKHNQMGTPQGGVISPLLANWYMNRFLKHWRQQDKGSQFRAQIINYADDFVIVSHGCAQAAMEWTQRVMSALGLSLNPHKTSIKDSTRERFDFLGYSFGPECHRKTGRRYLAMQPSQRSIAQIKQRIAGLLRPANVAPWGQTVLALNRVLRGWANYFSLGLRWKSYRAVDWYVINGVRNFLQRRHQVPTRGTRRFSAQHIHDELGVVRLKSLLERSPA
jgi:RNA-directed DNA polymerase